MRNLTIKIILDDKTERNMSIPIPEHLEDDISVVIYLNDPPLDIDYKFIENN